MYQRRLDGCCLAEDDVWLAIKVSSNRYKLFLEDILITLLFQVDII